MTAISWQHLTWADFAIVGIILVSAGISLIRGFVREAISLATWVVAAWVAVSFVIPFAHILAPHIHSSALRNVVAFAILFVAVLIIGGLINHLFSQLVENTGLSGTDRLLGLLFGLARGILLVAVLVLLGNMSSVHSPAWQQSQLIPQFQGMAHWLQKFVPQEVNQFTDSFKTPTVTFKQR